MLTGELLDFLGVYAYNIATLPDAIPSGKFVDKWTSADLDSYRVVVENKPVKPDVNILEALVKFIEAHELDTSKVVEICGLIDDGATELPKGFLD